MVYRIPRSIDDIMRLKTDCEPENPYLEYKSGKLLDAKNGKVFETLSKEIAAFGNSAGGVIIVGVDENSERCISEISPVKDTSKTDSWIEDGILPRVSPPISFDILTLETEGGRIFVIDVPPSHSAPHQASDRKYYARRLYRVDPLLSFEVDDIRRRVISSPVRVTSEIWFENGLINFKIRNDGVSPVFDVSFGIDGIPNAEISNEWTPGLSRPYTEAFKVIHPESELNFLGAGFEFFNKKLTDSLSTTVSFTDKDGKRHEERRQYFLKDFETTQRPLSRTERSLEEIKEELSKVSRAIQDLAGIARSVKESAFHASGLNLSKTTLSALSGEHEWRWSGENLDHMGLAEVLEVDPNVAVKIWQEMYGAYHLMGGQNISIDDLDVPEDVKEKVRERLNTPKT